MWLALDRSSAQPNVTGRVSGRHARLPKTHDKASHQERDNQQQHKSARFPFSDNHVASLDAVRAFLVRLAVDLFTKLRFLTSDVGEICHSER
jgi:hypothetical protein